MAPKNFEFGDLVWAKMKGYPPWPGKIIEPPSASKPKSKKCHYVLFFGSENHAWISDDNIELHSESVLRKCAMKKGTVFLRAVQTIIEFAKNNPKYHESLHSSEQNNEPVDEMSFGNIAKKDKSSKNKTCQNIKKEIPLKKKSLRRYAHSFQQNEPSTSSNSKYFSTEDIDMPIINEAQNQSTSTNVKVCQSPPPEAEVPESFEYIERPKSPPIDLMYQSDFMREKTISATKKKIGFLGLSKIGQAIVRNLYHTGHSIIIWNDTIDEYKRFTEKFKLRIAKTPVDVFRAADITFCYMTDSETARKLFFRRPGFLDELQHTFSKGYVELSSMDPKVSQYIDYEIRMKGGRYLQAPICGSRKEADESSLYIMAAGDKTLYDDCKSCLDAISKEHVYVHSDVGTALKLDIVHNMVVGTAYAAAAESLALINTMGLDGEAFKEILSKSLLYSPELLEKFESMMKSDYTTDVPLKHIQEQFNFGLSIGDEAAQCTPIFSTTREVYKQCMKSKYGEHDVSAVFEEARK